MYLYLYLDHGICSTEEKRREIAIWEEKFIEENHDCYASILESQESFRIMICFDMVFK
jgi:hypothetical protein